MTCSNPDDKLCSCLITNNPETVQLNSWGFHYWRSERAVHVKGLLQWHGTTHLSTNRKPIPLELTPFARQMSRLQTETCKWKFPQLWSNVSSKVNLVPLYEGFLLSIIDLETLKLSRDTRTNCSLKEFVLQTGSFVQKGFVTKLGPNNEEFPHVID